jgi:hypothetical protein
LNTGDPILVGFGEAFEIPQPYFELMHYLKKALAAGQLALLLESSWLLIACQQLRQIRSLSLLRLFR